MLFCFKLEADRLLLGMQQQRKGEEEESDAHDPRLEVEERLLKPVVEAKKKKKTAAAVPADDSAASAASSAERMVDVEVVDVVEEPAEYRKKEMLVALYRKVGRYNVGTSR